MLRQPGRLHRLRRRPRRRRRPARPRAGRQRHARRRRAGVRDGAGAARAGRVPDAAVGRRADRHVAVKGRLHLQPAPDQLPEHGPRLRPRHDPVPRRRDQVVLAPETAPSG
jgi:hypothetical protein